MGRATRGGEGGGGRRKRGLTITAWERPSTKGERAARVAGASIVEDGDEDTDFGQ